MSQSLVAEVEIANRQNALQVKETPLRRAVELIAREAAIETAEVSIAILTDDEIQQLNRRHLEHDYATDCISFVFQRDDKHLEGEILVSAETAISSASELNWPAEHELLLYVVHGMLHLVGYDDKQPAARQQMRAAERNAMTQLGIHLPDEQGVE